MTDMTAMTGMPGSTGTATSRARRTAAALPLALGAAALAALVPATAARAADGTMPDLSGKGLVSAYQALNYDTGVRLHDGRGAGRHVLWPGSWKVCDQRPRPGTPLRHQKIVLTVVKANERCGGHGAQRGDRP
ncbi:hypothetical protein MUU72_05440 [Streptomyces sp. RS10V-4]|uniref:hypothetical protein n=1 Tax=Streptomyces rhizoryzae TaxID=2932493 RepID=UPI002004F1C4|nr:hypothetical protein [Streptomyces rhizoryzae]MCK7622555.1 hypothetical protein [Streptomyces rhizoryzae]